MRLREHGLRVGDLEPGAANSIADVDGVRVGHVTVRRDEPAVARTGVTVVVPPALPVAANAAVLNGARELTGYLQLREWGLLETPIYLTSTMAVGRVFDGAVAAAIAADPRVGVEDVVIPVVGECDDSWLSDARVQHVEPVDAGRALAAATANVIEGSVGAGTGMVSFGCKGGIGTSSRRVPGGTVGALVLANFGAARELRIAGVEVGRRLGLEDAYERVAGSCIVVLAADAALGPHQLERLARRAGLGLARVGSTAHHGSGEIFVAFATAAEPPVPDRDLDPFFQAAVDATEEAALNALWAGEDTVGREARTVRGLPREDVLQLLGLGR